jgi:hypothetical protein
MNELLRLRGRVQAALSQKIQKERAALESKLGELADWEGDYRTSRRAVKRVAKRARKRSPVYIRYYDPATARTYSNRGPMATWLREKKEAGENIDRKYRVSETNPLPKRLAHLTPPQ